jgi:hypothetical protein
MSGAAAQAGLDLADRGLNLPAFGVLVGEFADGYASWSVKVVARQNSSPASPA